MPSLLVLVFALQLLIHLINTVGASSINNLLWMLYNRIPSSTSKDVQKQNVLRKEIVRLKREMSAISPQEEFAKWAKLSRQHDKAVAEYDQKSQSIQSFKSSFDSSITVARWLGTNGLRLVLQFWYAKIPMFWFPKGWVPWYIEWLLAFPRAPTGSVSIQVWGTACAMAIKLVASAVEAGVVLIFKQGKQGKEVKQKEPMKMGGRTGAAAGGGGRKGEKNEL